MDAQIGPYRIIERLGAGGMGEVFLAEDTRLGRKVALKRLTGTNLPTDDARRRLLREAAAAAALSHPGIAGIYDILDTEAGAHIVMEYVPGDTLASLVRRGVFKLDRLLPIAIQICDALAAAHAQGIVHRDLKPANIHLTPEGRTKILDFGLAQQRHAKVGAGAGHGSAPISGGELVGTPAYMAPEQLLGEAVDRRADVYSLGVTLYELATGKLPFEGDSFMGIALSVLTAPPPDVSRVLGPALGPIVAKAMAREPQARYQSVAELRRDLERLSATLDDAPTVAMGPGLSASRHSRRPFVVVVVVIIAIMLGLLVWSLWRGQPALAEGPPVVAVVPLETSSPDPRDASLGLGVADALVSDLAGTRGLVVVPSGTGSDTARHAGDVARLARSLGASYVLGGGVQVVGGQVRINVRLMRPDGAALQGVTEEGPRDDLLRMQRRVALALTDLFAVRLSAAERERLDRRPTTDLDTLRLYSDGRALFDRRDVPGTLPQATALFEQATARDPSFALAHAALSEAYWAQYQATRDEAFVTRALDAAQRALSLDPVQPDVRYALALIYKGTGQLDRAAEQLRQSIARQPDHDGTHRLLGEVLAAQGKTDLAVAEVQRAVALRPGFWENHNALGRAYLSAGRYREAAVAFEQVTRLQPHSPSGHQRLGATYQVLGDDRAALAEYRQAIQLGGTAGAYSNLALLEYRAGRYREAAESYEQARRLKPNDPVLLRNLGDTYRRLGRANDARNAYEQGVTLTTRMLGVNPTDGLTLSTRAILLAKLGRRTEALEAATRAVAAASRDPLVLYERAVVYAILGDKAAAFERLSEALAAGYPRADVLRDDEWRSLAGTAAFEALLRSVNSGEGGGFR